MANLYDVRCASDWLNPIEKKSGAAVTGDAYPAIERQELLSASVPQSLQGGPFKEYEYDEDKALQGNNKFTSFIIPDDAVQEIAVIVRFMLKAM